MCGRLSLFVPPRRVAERFDVRTPDWDPRYNVAPGDDLAVVRDDERGTVSFATWGYVPEWADAPGDGHANARAERAAEAPAFRDAVAGRRCLVLADGFYEWTDGGRPYRVRRADGAPFAMAGLWSRPDGDPTVAVLTTAAGDLLAPIHDRMPVLLPPDAGRRWLAGDPADPLLEPRDPEAFERYPVSTAVNDPAADDPSLVEPVDATRQESLGEF